MGQDCAISIADDRAATLPVPGQQAGAPVMAYDANGHPVHVTTVQPMYAPQAAYVQQQPVVAAAVVMQPPPAPNTAQVRKYSQRWHKLGKY